MSDLAKCKREGCGPVQQSRGLMKPEDHHMQFGRYGAVKEIRETHGIYTLDLEEYRRDAFETENEAEFADDVRISCAKCGKATGWIRRDIEEYRRHGDGDHRRHVLVRDGNIDALHQRWNDSVK